MAKKVLIVEDEEKLINNLADKLRAEGYDVYTALDGETGWALARGDTYDLIVLDIMLPGLDGLSLCRMIRQDPKMADVPIIIFTARGTEMDTIAAQGSGAGEFLRPWGIAAAWSTDRVYVLDSFRNDVQVFSRTGRLLERLAVPVRGDFLAAASNGLLHVLNSDTRGRGNRAEAFAPGAAPPRRSFPIAAASPRAIDTDIYGRDIYVTDIKGQRVLRYDEHGALSAQWGGPGSGPAQFRDPWGVAVDRYRTRRIYVADTGNDRVQAFTRDGRLLATWGEKGGADGQFDSPIDIAVDTSHGYVYVLDRNNTRVQVFTPDGEFLGKWGAPGAGPGEFVDPYGIDIDGEGTVYVLDTGNRRVQVFRLQWE